MNQRDRLLQFNRSYSRRDSLRLLGLGAATTFIAPRLVQAGANDLCALTPELTVGPYYVKSERIRKDITEDKPGIPMLLRITVLDAMKCTPLKNAAVDIWHCDALGFYSGYTAQSPDKGFGPPEQGAPGSERGDRGPGGPFGFPGAMGGPPQFDDEQQFAGPTDELTFFRGVQFTDDKGVAEFKTIYPGWYTGRATHIHMKVHVGGNAEQEHYAGGHVCHIGQLAFPEDISDRVGLLPPYANHKLQRTRLTEDTVFTEEDAPHCMVKLRSLSTRDLTRGFIAETAITVDSALTPKPAPMNGPGMRRDDRPSAG